jgi:hypothetical protein
MDLIEMQQDGGMIVERATASVRSKPSHSVTVWRTSSAHALITCSLISARRVTSARFRSLLLARKLA